MLNKIYNGFKVSVIWIKLLFSVLIIFSPPTQIKIWSLKILEISINISVPFLSWGYPTIPKIILLLILDKFISVTGSLIKISISFILVLLKILHEILAFDIFYLS